MRLLLPRQPALSSPNRLPQRGEVLPDKGEDLQDGQQEVGGHQGGDAAEWIRGWQGVCLESMPARACIGWALRVACLRARPWGTAKSRPLLLLPCRTELAGCI